MTCVRLHAPAIVLLTWAATWAAGLVGSAIVALWLVVTAGGLVVSELERKRLRRRLRRDCRNGRPA